jgi:RNA polymerase sigma-70 factor (sigma-E family)
MRAATGDVMRESLPLLGVVEDFEAFYRREYPRAVGLALALTGRRHLAEEIAQDAFIAAMRHWQKIAGYDQPAAWLRRVVVNRATSVLRRGLVEVRALPRLRVEAADVPEISPGTDEVWTAVRRLPRRQAQAVALFYLEDLSLEQIGEVLDCSPGTVKAHLHRARVKLGTVLHAWKEEL